MELQHFIQNCWLVYAFYFFEPFIYLTIIILEMTM